MLCVLCLQAGPALYTASALTLWMSQLAVHLCQPPLPAATSACSAPRLHGMIHLLQIWSVCVLTASAARLLWQLDAALTGVHTLLTAGYPAQRDHNWAPGHPCCLHHNEQLQRQSDPFCDHGSLHRHHQGTSPCRHKSATGCLHCHFGSLHHRHLHHSSPANGEQAPSVDPQVSTSSDECLPASQLTHLHNLQSQHDRQSPLLCLLLPSRFAWLHTTGLTQVLHKLLTMQVDTLCPIGPIQSTVPVQIVHQHSWLAQSKDPLSACSSSTPSETRCHPPPM